MTRTHYEWIAAGEEWSEPWGGSAPQWFGSILPRIHAALPAGAILEIGSGFGRWSVFLRQHCRHLHLVDPDAQCMDACRRRFASDPEISFHLNQRDSLETIADGTVDFIFSFDSLVHVRRSTLDTYLGQFRAKLKPNGLAFVHHSNLGQFESSLSRRARVFAGKVKAPGADHQRDPEMTARLFRELSGRHGLKVVCQELVNWRGRRLIDCFSLVAPPDAKWPSARHPYRNSNFMREAELIRRRARRYPKA